VGSAPLDSARIYTVVTNDFLVTGRERGLDYLKPGNPELDVRRELRDIRMALLDELRRSFP
jgi:5'-nucleotidase